MSFRPRRRTASTSGCSSRACTLHGAAGAGGGAGSTKSPPLVINHNHLSNRMEAADLIERCSSGSRSMASSPSMSVQPLTASAASAASASNSEVTEGPRVKKISLEEAQQFRKEVLDPQFPEPSASTSSDYEAETVFISENSAPELRELPLLHDEPLLLNGKQSRRKISRHYSASFSGTPC